MRPRLTVMELWLPLLLLLLASVPVLLGWRSSELLVILLLNRAMCG